MNLAVFGYNFPHKKTQDFLQRLALLDMRPAVVLLADFKRLGVPTPAIRVKPRHCDLVQPQLICKRFGIPFHVVDHASDQCVEHVMEARCDLGVIAGARILPGKVIDRIPHGVINFHPGRLPDVRGLDALQWAVYDDLPLAVTSHLIDVRIDAGRIIERTVIDELEDDTLLDLGLRLYETQIGMLESSIRSAVSSSVGEFEVVQGGTYRRSFPKSLVSELREKFENRKRAKRRAA